MRLWQNTQCFFKPFGNRLSCEFVTYRWRMNTVKGMLEKDTFWIKTNIKKCEWLVTQKCSDLSSNRYSIKFYSQLSRGGTPKVAFSWCLRWLVSTPSTVELKTIYDPLREEQEKHPPGLRFHSLRHLRNCLQSKSDNFKQANYGRKNPGCRSTLFMKIQYPKTCYLALVRSGKAESTSRSRIALC